MDVDRQKLKIVQWVLGLKDAQVLAALAELAADAEFDLDTLSVGTSSALQRSLAQADAGELIPQSEVMESIRIKWLSRN